MGVKWVEWLDKKMVAHLAAAMVGLKADQSDRMWVVWKVVDWVVKLDCHLVEHSVGLLAEQWVALMVE